MHVCTAGGGGANVYVYAHMSVCVRVCMTACKGACPRSTHTIHSPVRNQTRAESWWPRAQPASPLAVPTVAAAASPVGCTAAAGTAAAVAAAAAGTAAAAAVAAGIAVAQHCPASPAFPSIPLRSETPGARSRIWCRRWGTTGGPLCCRSPVTSQHAHCR